MCLRIQQLRGHTTFKKYYFFVTFTVCLDNDMTMTIHCIQTSTVNFGGLSLTEKEQSGKKYLGVFTHPIAQCILKILKWLPKVKKLLVHQQANFELCN